jgi:parvulin-like peptidyl-prolyl isomerase
MRGDMFMIKSAKLSSLGILVAGLLFLAGCDMIQNMFSVPGVPKVIAKTTASQAAESAQENVGGTLLAKVNNVVITLESFDDKVKAIEGVSSDIKINTADAKKTYLNDLVTQELLIQEARARGIDKKKEVIDAINEFNKQVLIRQLVMDETKGITVDPAEIETFYNKYKKEFAAPEVIKASEIVVSSEATAKEVLIGILQGGDFAAVAREKSIAASASKGGSVGEVKKGDRFDKFLEVVSTLEAGQVSQIFKGSDGFYIVKVDEKKGGTIPPLNEVYDQIKNGLLQQKTAARLQELTDKLKREATIVIKEELLR